jgi:hypothetical protein
LRCTILVFAALQRNNIVSPIAKRELADGD